MAFLTLETSTDRGEPVMLFEFRRSAALRSLLAGSDFPVVTSGGDTYDPCPISAGSISQKGDPVANVYEITAPDNIAVADWYRYTPPSDPIYVIVREYHYGDPEGVVVWIGNVTTIINNDAGKVSINCQAVSVTLKRGGLRLAWQRGCPHALYDQNCGLDKSLRVQVRTITAILGQEIQIDTPLPSYDITPDVTWAGGFLEFLVATATYERRMVEYTGGRLVTPFGNMDGYSVGQTLNFYPGCLRTSVYCDVVFNNIANYGGFQYLPQRSPYDGDPVF